MGKVLSIIILGGTGIIGRELAHLLVAQGHTVYIVSRGVHQIVDGAISIITDVHSPNDFNHSIKELTFDVVVDLVSFNPDQLGSLLKSFEGKCRQYMFVSSATIYDDAKDGVINEDSTRIRKGWSYPLAKIESEKLLRRSTRQTGQIFTIVRPYITYSEQRLSFGVWELSDIGQRLREEGPVVIGTEVASAFTTLTHAADLALGMAGLMGNDKAYNEDFNITSSKTIRWNEVYRLTARSIDKNLTIVDVPTRDLIVAFPELAGKISDRLMNRTFDNSKLYEACPDLAMSHSVKDDYNKIIRDSYKESNRLLIDYFTQGRMNKFMLPYVKTGEVRSALKKYERILYAADSFKLRFAYVIGLRSPWLLPFMRKVRFIIGRKGVNHYGA